jgi:ATP-binding cassette subfamily B (MDR/TAP) protein 1
MSDSIKDKEPISITPSSSPDEGKSAKKAYFKLLTLAEKWETVGLIFAALTAIVSGASGPLIALIFGNMYQSFIDYRAGNMNLDEFKASSHYYTLWYVYLAIIVFFTTYVTTTIFRIVGERISIRLRRLYLTSVLHQDISWFDCEGGAGGVATRTTSDILLIQDAVSEKMALIILDCAACVSGYVVSLIYNWRMGLVLSFIVPGTALLVFIMEYLMTKFTDKSMEIYNEASNLAEESFSHIKTAITYNQQKKLGDKYFGFLIRAEKSTTLRAASFAIGLAIISIFVFFSYAIGFYYSGKLLFWQLASPSSVVIVINTIFLGANAFSEIGPNLQALTLALSTSNKLFETIDRPAKIHTKDDTEGTIPEKVSGRIEFKNLTFSYPSRPDVQVLKGFNLEVNPFTTVALVGSSGSGKSTIIQLLERFYIAQQGSIDLDGIPIPELNVKWLRRQLGLVSQEPTLFIGTIAENIASGFAGSHLETESPEVQMEAIVEACKTANAHDFISTLPKGYHTQVGERGFLLSGGQKQRIAIARAIVKNPSILLLDEATSALDSKSEAAVQLALDRASKNRTTIVIAHRLATIKNADAIVVMNEGKIIEKGTHQELMGLENGYYANLVQIQSLSESAETKKEESTEPKSAPGNHGSTQAALPKQNVRISHVSSTLPTRMSLEYVNKSTHSLSLSHKEAPVTEVSTKPRSILKLAGKLLVLNKSAKIYYLGMLIGCGIVGSEPIIFETIVAHFMGELDKPGEEVLRSTEYYSILAVILGVAAGFGCFFQEMGLGKSAEMLTTQVRHLAYSTILKQEMGWFDRTENSSGALTSLLSSDAQNIHSITGITLGVIFKVLLNLIIGVIMALCYGWKLGLVACATLPIMMVMSYLHERAHFNFESDTESAYAKSAEIACEAVGAIRTVAALTIEKNVMDKYMEQLHHTFKVNERKTLVTAIIYSSSTSLIYLITALILYYGSILFYTGEYSLEQMFTVLNVIVAGTGGTARLFVYIPDVSKAKTAANRVFDLAERVPLIKSKPSNDNKELTINGHIKLENVQFQYPTRPHIKVLRGVDLEAKPGQFIALVGPSGCGKSTTLGILQRFYDIASGSVTIDGTAIEDFPLVQLRDQIAVVSQEPSLYNLTIRENIAWGARSSGPAPTEAQIIEACKLANIHDFISKLPNGYDTSVGAMGSQLSGGQKQRIAIARALVRNPKILLLDEATSALDAQSEKMVQEALDNASDGRTTIAVAHRLSTIKRANVIYVFKDGKIVEQGTHSELVGLGGIYFSMVQEQNLNEVEIELE